MALEREVVLVRGRRYLRLFRFGLLRNGMALQYRLGYGTLIVHHQESDNRWENDPAESYFCGSIMTFIDSWASAVRRKPVAASSNGKRCVIICFTDMVPALMSSKAVLNSAGLLA